MLTAIACLIFEDRNYYPKTMWSFVIADLVFGNATIALFIWGMG